MPQLSKGGKWVFGWAIVGPDMDVLIPTQAFQEYGFHEDAPVVFTLGSKRSGGFGIGHKEKVASSLICSRIIGEGLIGKEMHIYLRPTVDINPGEQLLVVRGSNLALGFLLRGPIVDEARLHPELEVYQS
ncbi:MAG: hypothetical protein GX421_09305 [Caldisericales bacterium]|jgi:hypothetical protein|nr:hypothetical protein [Caldisericales bacterium]